MARAREVLSQQQGPRTDVSVSLRMLVLIRWVAVLGQGATILFVHYGLGFVLPVQSALAVIGTSAALNIAASWPRRRPARLGDREAALYLAYDILQLGMLLFLTGGLHNPFAILMLAPVTVSATILSRRSVFWLSALTVAAISVLAVFHFPLPWREMPLPPPPLYVLGVWTALVSSTMFIGGYTWSVAEEARRMRDAYTATQLALAREQRVSAVGGIAAAAAHQLGSPLATIAVVAKELVRDLPAGSPYAEDALLLLSQSERCRTILADLAHQPRQREQLALRRPAVLGAGRGGGRALRRDRRRRRLCDGGGTRRRRPPGRGAAGAAQPRDHARARQSHPERRPVRTARGRASPPPGPKTPSPSTSSMTVRASRSRYWRASASLISPGAAAAARHSIWGSASSSRRACWSAPARRVSFANLADGGAQVVVEWKRTTLEGVEGKPAMKETV